MSDAALRRVAVLDLFARADGFVGDASMRALAARLESTGHEVRLVRSVLAEDADGDVVRWHARLGEFLRGDRFDVVVLPRVWDDHTIEVLRGAAAANTKFVRLSSGVTARLDDRFDHVLGLEGLLALLGGDEHPQAAAWTRTTPKELREREASRPSLLQAGTVGYERLTEAPQPLPGAATGARPTITGPATGCPFLLDARKMPVYRELKVDDTRVQMKGCTFCLDNIGSYAAPSEDAMVGAWMAQLRQVRAARPATPDAPRLEVLCTDERPHPYLPALFRAIAAEPGLGPIELLVKSRVDWLLEFADGPVAEACELAKTSGSLLHVYLVGFESFDQFHLDLFNKGVTVADNVAAIGKLHELAARFPTSFEWLRFRAHGIVLFTPWTRPEHLLENARVMREVRFHELRTEALRTRLRLYPRVPLHALAERDGLLTEAFTEGRGDRAAEQGYDASVPWRFADPRTEAIFRVANTPELRKRDVSDADVLEAATRFVLRWPGLASAPDLAPLPFEQALRIWAPSAAVEGGASSLGFDPEVDGIAAGVKDACLKEGVPRDAADSLVAAYRAMGLSAAVVWTHGVAGGGDIHGDGDAFAIVAVAKDEATLAAVLEAQRAHRSHGEVGHTAARTMGRLMGYPACCTDAFLAQNERGDNLDNERRTFERGPAQPLSVLLNRFGVVRLASHHPCTPSCAPSVANAERLLSHLAESDPRAAAWVREQLAAPVLVLDYARRIQVRGKWNGATFLVEESRCLDDVRRFGFSIEGLSRIEIGARRTTLFGAGDVVLHEAEGAKLLVVPGQPLAPCVLAAITRATVPMLPRTVAPGAAFVGYRIASVETATDREGTAGHRIELAMGAARLIVRVRAFDPARTQTLRSGAFAFDVEAVARLGERERAALVALATTIARVTPRAQT